MTILRRKNPQGPKPLVWRGYRNCERCTRWRPVSDFTVSTTRTGYEQIKGECEHCKRQRAKDAYNKLTPEQKRAKGRKANKQAQQRRTSALGEIERLQKNLDKQNERIEKLWARIERGRKHMRMRHEENGAVTYVDIVPFRMWLLRYHREHGYNLEQLCDDINVEPRQVKRWLDGFDWVGVGRDPTAVRSIDIVSVDKVGIAVDDPGLLERLYPLLIDE